MVLWPSQGREDGIAQTLGRRKWLAFTYWVADKKPPALQRRSFMATMLQMPEEQANPFDSWPALWRWLALRLAEKKKSRFSFWMNSPTRPRPTPPCSPPYNMPGIITCKTQMSFLSCVARQSQPWKPSCNTNRRSSADLPGSGIYNHCLIPV